ncbi:MogA/MoaB family molybdenum cofactor biosynthesis protein [Paenibacillus pinistramenti]|uniref:MogA/MoaB family molybdenum cofactor biosynthesis protein n=1 Tax=Paenibacillus pinistramenti TaxID=1768003 RepID=UPI0011081674|nr:MogA/MoaB family molybdenum cofactor biosynthesis protein [Paenibacillus pinistramenti]
MRSVDEHKQQAPASVACQVITVSDTRSPDNDTSGKLMMELLENGGFSVVDYRIVKDDYEALRNLLHESSEDKKIEAVLLTGGTGISPRDTTYEAVRSMLSLGKELPGFGELFRYLSFTEDIGSAAILSRAMAGVIGETAIFSMPGSSGAVKLAMERIILPELRHIMRELYKA